MLQGRRARLRRVHHQRFHPPRRRLEEPPLGSNDGDGSGIEAARRVKAHRQDRENARLVWNRVVVTFVGSLQPFGCAGRR